MNARWMWITLAALVAVVPWARWGDAPRDAAQARRTEVFKPVEAAQSRARQAALRTAFQIQFLDQVERFSAAAVDAWEAGAPLDVGPDTDADRRLDPGDIPAAEARARAQLERWGLDAPRVAVGLYLPDGDLDWPAGAGVARPPTSRWGRIVDGHLADGRPYCIQVGRLTGPIGPDVRGRTLPWALLDDSKTGPGAYGPCWLHARYGAPGHHVAEWMRATGLSAAVSSHAFAWWDDPDRHQTDRRILNALGLRNTAWLDGRLGEEPRVADACIAGDAQACARIFLMPTGAVPQSVEADLDGSAPGSSTVVAFSSNYLPENWLHTLEATYGPERMAAFWTSEADVVTAFEEAFDADLETAMMAVGRARFGDARPGPRVAGWGWLGLLAALLAGLGGAASAVGLRRVA